MKPLTTTTKTILSEIYTKLGGRPADEKKKNFNDQTKTKTAKDSEYYSFENWWDQIKPSLPEMSKTELISIKGELERSSGYYASGGQVVEMETFKPQLDYINAIISSN